MRSKLLLLLALTVSAPFAAPAFAAPSAIVSVAEFSKAKKAFADETMATVTATATAVETADGETVPPTSKEDLDKLWESIGGLKGASAAFIAYFVAQLLMMLLKSSLGYKFTGGWQLVAVYGMTVVLSVLGFVALGGLSWGAALTHSQTVTAFSVLFNQIMKKTGINA